MRSTVKSRFDNVAENKPSRKNGDMLVSEDLDWYTAEAQLAADTISPPLRANGSNGVTAQMIASGTSPS